MNSQLPYNPDREKRFWLGVALVLGVILTTLLAGPLLLDLWGDQNLQAIVFGTALLLIAATALSYGWSSVVGRSEIALLLGLLAVFLLLFLRLGLAERSHLMEYGVLSLFLHGALVERAKQSKLPTSPALLACVISILIGVLDESLQLLLPRRVFDWEDIVFNSLAASLAIAGSLLLGWLRHKRRPLQQ